MTTLVEMDVPVVWDYVRAVRRRVGDMLSAYPDAVREATQMAASELVENAVKYGERVPNCEMVSVRVWVEDSELCIAVANGVRSGAKRSALREHLSRIRAAPDREELYLRRIKELLEDTSQHGKLGLYRIKSEGGFELDMSEDRDVVTINAKRTIP